MPARVYLLVLVLVTPQLALAQGALLSLSSNPVFVCPSAGVAVGLFSLVNNGGSPQTIAAGTVMSLTFDAPIAVAPAITGLGTFTSSVSGSTLTVTLQSNATVAPSGTVSFSGAKLDLQGLANGTNVNVTFLVNPAGAIIFPAGNNQSIVARVGCPTIVLAPSLLSFRTQRTDPPNQTITVSNSGGGVFNWTATASTSSGGAWLSISPQAGTGGGTLTVSVSVAALNDGAYTGTITVTCPEASNSPQTVVVSLVVGAPLLVVNTTSLTFSGTTGFGVPAQQIIVSNGGGGTLKWSATTAVSGNTPNWLSTAPTSGTGSPFSVLAVVNTAGLGPGTYQGTITFTAEQASNPPQTVNVTLTLVQPRIALSSTSLTFTGQQGKPNPASQTVNVSNSGAGTFNWTASAATQSGGNWLSVSPASGTGAGTLTVSVNIADLNAGDYQGTIELAAVGAANTPQTIKVALTITPSGAAVIALNPASLQFAAAAGAGPATQTFQVQNAGTGALGWTAVVSTQSGGNWLAVSPTTGVAPSTLTMTVNSSALPAGTYAGFVIITALASANAGNSPQVLPVTLAVGVPVVGQDGIVNGASFSKDAMVSPLSIASLFGSYLSTGIMVATDLPLPTLLGGTQVLVNEKPVPLFYVSPSQVNFQAPADTVGTLPVAVISGGIRGSTSMVKIEPEVPGIFTAVPGGTGQGAVLNQDFSRNSAQNPAAAGSVVQIFATGLGATNPPISTGLPGASKEPFNLTVMKPVVLIGGASAEVLFSAMAPGFVGLYQVNARVPPGTPASGGVPLQIQMGGRSSNTVSIAVR